jgi:hypothetical protein
MNVLLNVKLKNGKQLFSIDEITYYPTGSKFSVCIDVKDILKWIESNEVKSIKIKKLYEDFK